MYDLSTKLKLNYENYDYKNVHLKDESSMPYAPDRFVWSEISKANYQEAFSNQVIQDKIDNIKHEVISDKIDVDAIVNSISDIIVSATDMSLKRKSYRMKKKKTRKINKKMV